MKRVDNLDYEYLDSHFISDEDKKEILQKMNSIDSELNNKRKIKKKKLKSKVILSASIIGLAAGFVLISKAHPYYDTHTGEFGLMFVNTKNYHYSNEEFLKLFKEKFEADSDFTNNFDDIYPEVCDFISNYGEYLDQEEILDSMSTFKVEIIDDSEKEFNAEDLAGFNPYSNIIVFKPELMRMKPEKAKEVKFHEFLHFLFKQQFSGCGTKALDEGTVSLITREYDVYSGIDVYEKESYYVRAVCELVGKDRYMRAFGNHNYKELYDYLEEYSSISEIKKLMKEIDQACCYYDSKGTEHDTEAWNIINKMYEEKNGVTIENSDDEIMKIYSNKLADTHYKITGARSYYQAIANKKYFVKSSEDEPEIIYRYYKKDYGSAQLDNNNEFVSGDILEDGFYDESGNVVDEDGKSIEAKKVKIK